jgi:mono/diheme cytochrome c family protein
MFAHLFAATAFVFFVFTPSFATALPISEVDTYRSRSAKDAEAALLNLNFFYNGRGMLAPPNFPPFLLDSNLGETAVEIAKGTLRRNYGIIVEDKKAIGVFQGSYKGVNASLVGCAVCHTGRAAGYTIPGLGNKNIDVYKLGQSFRKHFETIRNIDSVIGKGDAATRKMMFENFETFMTNLSDPQLHNLTQGLVSTGIIRKWFYDNAGKKMDHLQRGQVKVPAFWGYGEKRKVGAFADGFGNGALGGWAIAVELVAGQTPENVKQYVHKIEQAEEKLGELMPPLYPFAIDQVKAAIGEKLFAQSCSGCHGNYVRTLDGLPRYEAPKWIPWEVVQTDQGRLRGLTDLFLDLVKNNPLNEIIQSTDIGGRGYFAPRLHGVWARFPYLHNGSVPTIMDLLNPPATRPKLFSLMDAGELRRFDAINLGLNKDSRIKDSQLLKLAKQNKRYIFDTSRVEHANAGHYFAHFAQLKEQDKRALIEYLKTL